MRLPSAQDIDLAECHAWPAFVKAVCCAVVSVFTAAAGYALVLSGSLAALGAAQAETARLTAELRRTEALAGRGAAVGEREAAAAALADLLAKLPAASEVPGVLAGISRAATAAGLDIARVELGDERPSWLASPPLEVAPEDAPPYLELPLEIQVHGGYHQLGAFAAAVAALPHLVAFGDFTLQPMDGDPSRLTLAATARTYRHVPSEEAEP